MREIKFRVFDYGKESLGVSPRMSEPFGIWYAYSLHFKSDDDTIPLGFAQDDERFVLMQFTGLKDKNGVEIYEGDIVEITPRIEGESKFRGQIVYQDHDARFQFDDGDGCYGIRTNDPCNEVIGNVYEQPELLAQPETKPERATLS